MKATSRKALDDWLGSLAERYTVVAPQMVETELLYRPVSPGTEIIFDFERTVLSPKSFFLPDTQVILNVEKRGKEVMLDEPVPVRSRGQAPEKARGQAPDEARGQAIQCEQVVFGVRPCDARGLQALDALLLERAPPDLYYSGLRAKSILVGLACPKLWEDCFCTSLGGAPDDASDLDLLLHKVDGDYLVQVVTERGAALLNSLAVHPTDHELPKTEAARDQVAVVPPEDWPSLFDDEYWQRLSDRCLSCHACTYVCPTCRCFDVRDETRSSGAGYSHIQRLRAWDSCLSAGYRRIAGGHNPRPTRAQRLRNRYYCKFHYSPLVFSTVACVGCGRCIAVCPVGIDIAEMLGDVLALTERRSGGEEGSSELDREGRKL